MRGAKPAEPIKTAGQQAALMLIGMRSRLIHNRTQLTNAIRGFAMEFGLTTGTGTYRIEPLLERIAAHEALPELARELFALHARGYAQLRKETEKVIDLWIGIARTNVVSAWRKYLALAPSGTASDAENAGSQAV